MTYHHILKKIKELDILLLLEEDINISKVNLLYSTL